MFLTYNHFAVIYKSKAESLFTSLPPFIIIEDLRIYRVFFTHSIDASDCAKHPFLTIKAGLFYYLALHPNISKTVIDFIQEYSAIADMSTYDVLSFVTKDDEINNFTLGENGEKYLEKMIEDFRTIVR